MPNQRHASSMLTPDFDTYPARPIASIDVHPLSLIHISEPTRPY